MARPWHPGAFEMTKRRLITVALLLASPLLLYLVVANLLIATPLLETVINRRPNKFLVTWKAAATWWPGRLWVKDFRFSYSSPRIAFELDIDDARTHLLLGDLLHKRLHFTHTRSSGVAYRMVRKAPLDQPISPRVAEFPPIEGMSPLKTDPMRPPRTQAELDRLWLVNLDDIDTTFRELWLLEYHWKGRGYATGAFALKPLESLWVGPAHAELKGELTVGDTLVSRDVTADVDMFLTPVHIDQLHKILMLRGLQGEGTLSLTLDTLEFARVYGVEAKGGGRLQVAAQVKNGRVEPETKVALNLEDVRARLKKTGAGFDGVLALKAAVEGQTPYVHATGGGRVHVPLPDDQVAIAKVSEVGADVSLSSADLTRPVRLGAFDARVPELFVQDLEPVLTAYRHQLPPFTHALVSGHPLMAHHLEASGTLDDLQLHLGDVRVREARLNGNVEVKGRKPTGSLRLRVAKLPVGIRLEDGKTKIRLFPRHEDREP
ncbi:MAG: hypothetical protein IPJ65_03425 [Archangiaceae bacterium]|nr:hypothetical protein [Archangiaceae bacterium]